MKYTLKKLFLQTCILTMLGSSIVAYGNTKDALKSTSSVLLDGTAVSFEAYNIDDNNYFKLRDICGVLNVSVEWDAEASIITLNTKNLKTTIDSNSNITDASNKEAVENISMLKVDGTELAFQTYNIDGNNYFKLRDICSFLNIEISWDNDTQTIALDTSNVSETIVLDFRHEVITTGQTNSFDNDGNVIYPAEESSYYGQDSHYDSVAFSFTKNSDGTTIDNNTGLMWETIPNAGKMSWAEAKEYCENLVLGGYDDWRLPTAKELFSLSDFSEGWPFLDTDYFDFLEDTETTQGMGGGMTDGSPQGGGPQGSSSGSSDMVGEMGEQSGMMGGSPQSGMMGEMGEQSGMMGGSPQSGMMGEMGEQSGMMGGSPQSGMMGEMGEQSGMMGGSPQSGMMGDSTTPPPMSDGDGVSKDEGQFWADNYYLVSESNLQSTAFGVNHATGHIKAYPADSPSIMGKYVRAVRGDEYLVNDYVDNGDDTVTDMATGLMWASADTGSGVDWKTALALAEDSTLAGYSDWRLPDVKELQSIVDYSGVYPAIDQDYFSLTSLTENKNYYYWTNTSAYFSPTDPDYNSAWYVAFGFAVGDDNMDSHGAGAVRFSPKYEGSDAAAEGGDNILNSVRLVRNVVE